MEISLSLGVFCQHKGLRTAHAVFFTMMLITEVTCGWALDQPDTIACAQHRLKAEMWLPQGDLIPGLTEGTALSPFIRMVPPVTLLGKSGSSVGAFPYLSPILPVLMVFYLLCTILTWQPHIPLVWGQISIRVPWKVAQVIKPAARWSWNSLCQ